MGGRLLLALLGIAAGLSVGLALLDQWLEAEPLSPADFAFDVLEQVTLLSAVVGVAWLMVRLSKLRREQDAMREDLDRAVALGEVWRASNRAALDDLAAAIRQQFDLWSLTPAEADIAGLMLKGVPLREIGRLRRTSETTIRQQAQAVYRKSGLTGRAELSAFFLEFALR